jgi:lysylphosphatidylglycerol synthetase-like protein (DUF2156 family)
VAILLFPLALLALATIGVLLVRLDRAERRPGASVRTERGMGILYAGALTASVLMRDTAIGILIAAAVLLANAAWLAWLVWDHVRGRADDDEFAGSYRA